MRTTGTTTLTPKAWLHESPEDEERRRQQAFQKARRLSTTRRNTDIRERVTAATVRIDRHGAQGVLILGGYILTAAHCVKWRRTRGMAMGEHHFERIKTQDGRKLITSVNAVEPVADIAALGVVDNQISLEEADAFNLFASDIQGIPIARKAPRVGEFVPIQVLAHTKGWIVGVATRSGFPGASPGGTVCVQTDEPIRSGTSGGPVVDFDGRLIGVVSWSNESDKSGNHLGAIPLAYFALPRWLTDHIRLNRQQRTD